MAAMDIVACLDPEPHCIAAARSRDITLVPLWQMPDASVRLARWTIADGAIGERLRAARRGRDAARVLLLVPDPAALAAALDAGADDAAGHAADPVEVVARLTALLRRADGARPIDIGDLHIDRASRIVRRGGRIIRMVPREYSLLLYLAEHAGRAVSRDELLHAIWSSRPDAATNVVQVHVSRLRARLDTGGPPVLHTDRGLGYRLGDAISVTPPR